MPDTAMFVPLFTSLAWIASILFFIRQLREIPEGYEDELGFHLVPVSRGHHVRFQHDRRSHCIPRRTDTV